MRNKWYHCSQVAKVQKFSVAKRPPAHRTTLEPLTPRLCVCPSVALCFTARLFEVAPVHVYISEPRNGIRPRDVWDAKITGERWLIPPTTMHYAYTIPTEVVYGAQLAIRTYHRVTRKHSSIRLRIAQYFAAAEYVERGARHAFMERLRVSFSVSLTYIQEQTWMQSSRKPTDAESAATS